MPSTCAVMPIQRSCSKFSSNKPQLTTLGSFGSRITSGFSFPLKFRVSKFNLRDQPSPFLWTTTSTLRTSSKQFHLSWTITMPPKKAKKTADSINSRLALVMKSGKGEILIWSVWKHGTLKNCGLTFWLPTISHSRIQINAQDSPIWQSQAGHHCWQHPTSPQKRTRMYIIPICQKENTEADHKPDYSMLSKTNVHHFAGNNVWILISPSIPPWTHLPNDQIFDLKGSPNEEAP